MVKKATNLEELRGLAEGFIKAILLLPGSGKATVVGLSGDLGTGKTAFTKCVASVLGITEILTSPTYILEKVYIIPHGSIVGKRFAKLIHIDAYRLHSADEMRALDWETILLDDQNLIFIEWPEQVKEALPAGVVNLSFEYVGERVRSVKGDLI